MRFILLTLISIANLQSATIKGFVTSSEDGKPLFSNIYIKELSRNVKTDSTGYFEFDLDSGEYHLDFYAVLFRIEHIEINVNDEDIYFDVLLHPLEFHLEGVKVTGKRYSKFNKINKNLTITGREFNELQKSTIAGTIKNEAGIGVRSMGPAPARPVFRGVGGPSLSILEDGINSIDVSANSQDHAVALDPAFTKAVEIIRGPEILLYTSAANSAAINVKEENIPESELHKLQIYQKNIFESVSNRRLTSLELEAPLLGFQVLGNISHTSNSNIYTPVGDLENSRGNVFTYNLGVSKRFRDYFVGVSFKEHTNHYGIPPGGLGQHPRGVDIEMFKRNLEVIASHKLSNYKYFDEAKLLFNRTYFFQEEFESSGLLGARFLSENYNFRYELKTLNLFGFDVGRIGLSYMNNHYDVGGATFTPEVTSNEMAAFFNQKRNFGNWFIDFSGRYEFINRDPFGDQSTGGAIDVSTKNFNLFSSSIGLFYEKETNLFGLNVFRSLRAPSDEELFSMGPHLAAYSYEIGNTELNYMENYGYELSYSYNSEKIFIGINQYSWYYTNFITPRNTGEIDKIRTQLPIFQISNMEALFLGFDVSVSYNFTQNLKIESDVSYTFAENLDSNIPVPFIQPLKSNIKLVYNSNKYRFFIQSQIANSQERIDEFETPTDAYIIFDLGGSYYFTINSFIASLGISFENLTDAEYYNHLSRIKDIMPEPGFNTKLFLNIYY